VREAVPEGAQVASTAWDAQGEAQAALRTIVADPRYGPAALSSSQTMGNVLKDLLPDAPREANVLVAASDAGVADSLRNHLSQGMDLGTASRLAAGSFESRTALTPDACTWAVTAMATALRLDAAPGPGPAPETVLRGGQQDTVLPRGNEQIMTPAATGPGSGRPEGLSRAAAVIAAAGAFLVIWACALPIVTTSNSGRQSFSIFNSGSPGGLWFAVEPVGVAVIGVVAVLLVVVARTARLRWLAAGILVAFGIQTVLLFAGYEFEPRSPAHAGAGAAVGILGALLLLTAGVLGAVSQAAPSPPAATTPGR
jgi:hypothetical protein